MFLEPGRRHAYATQRRLINAAVKNSLVQYLVRWLLHEYVLFGIQVRVLTGLSQQAAPACSGMSTVSEMNPQKRIKRRSKLSL